MCIKGWFTYTCTKVNAFGSGNRDCHWHESARCAHMQRARCYLDELWIWKEEMRAPKWMTPGRDTLVTNEGSAERNSLAQHDMHLLPSQQQDQNNIYFTICLWKCACKWILKKATRWTKTNKKIQVQNIIQIAEWIYPTNEDKILLSGCKMGWKKSVLKTWKEED